MSVWSILLPFGIFCGRLDNFSRFGTYVAPGKSGNTGFCRAKYRFLWRKTFNLMLLFLSADDKSLLHLELIF
jgi:hypothetical protein